MQKHPVVFLDVDGVLAPYKQGTAWATLGKYELDALVNWDHVARLVTLVIEADALIVISSNWRHTGPGVVTLNTVLRRAGLADRVISATPGPDEAFQAIYGRGRRMSEYIETRGMEIALWLHRYEDMVSHLAILDDIDLRRHLCQGEAGRVGSKARQTERPVCSDLSDHVVWCDPFIGFNDQRLERARAALALPFDDDWTLFRYWEG